MRPTTQYIRQGVSALRTEIAIACVMRSLTSSPTLTRSRGTLSATLIVGEGDEGLTKLVVKKIGAGTKHVSDGPVRC